MKACFFIQGANFKLYGEGVKERGDSARGGGGGAIIRGR